MAPPQVQKRGQGNANWGFVVVFKPSANYSLRLTLDGNLTLLECTFALLRVTQLHFTLTPLNLPYFPRGVIQGFGLCWRAKRASLALGPPYPPGGPKGRLGPPMGPWARGAARRRIRKARIHLQVGGSMRDAGKQGWWAGGVGVAGPRYRYTYI